MWNEYVFPCCCEERKQNENNECTFFAPTCYKVGSSWIPNLASSSSNRNAFILRCCKILLPPMQTYHPRGYWNIIIYTILTHICIRCFLHDTFHHCRRICCVFFLQYSRTPFLTAVLHLFFWSNSKRPLRIDALFFRFYPDKTGLASEFHTHSPTNGEKITVTRFFHFFIRRKPKSALSLLFPSLKWKRASTWSPGFKMTASDSFKSIVLRSDLISD